MPIKNPLFGNRDNCIVMKTCTPDGGNPLSSHPNQEIYSQKRHYTGINHKGNFYPAFRFLYLRICGNTGFNHGKLNKQN